MNLPKSRKDAVKTDKKYYFTGAICKRGHMAKRYVSDGSCAICANERAFKRYETNGTEIKKHLRDRYAKDPEKFKAKVKSRCELHPEKIKAGRKANYEKYKQDYLTQAREWALNNPEKIKATMRKWLKNNPAIARHRVVLRRMRLKERLPKWLTEADRKAILYFYKKAREVSLVTGVKHQVDHIVPLSAMV